MKCKITSSLLSIIFFFMPAYSMAEDSLSSTLEKSRSLDQLLNQGYKKLSVIPNKAISDGIFVRRSYLNIVGRIPTATEAKDFIDSKQPAKRTQLIEKLINSDGFKSTLFLFYSELLRLQSNKEQYGAAMHHYIREAVEKNKPYDKMVYDMLAAKGHIAENPAVSYYLRDPGMTLDNVSNTMQVFLGTQVGCAQCHDHPFEDTTQMDFYQLAAFSGGFDHKASPTARKKLKEIALSINSSKNTPNTKTKNNNNKRQNKKDRKHLRSIAKKTSSVFRFYRRNDLFDNPSKELTLPHDYQYNDGKPGESIKPKTLFGKMPILNNSKDRRTVFAQWVTSSDNPLFSKVIANRLWSHAFGYGLAEPLDNWTERTKVSHQPALMFLEQEMRQNGFNLKQTLRILYHSKLFQREVSRINIEQGKTFHFAGPLLRRMTGEELHDSFLTLESGQLDNRKNSTRSNMWNNYVKNFKAINSLPPHKVLALAKGIKNADKASKKSRSEARNLKMQAAQARSNGDTETYNKLMKLVRSKYKKAKSETATSMQAMQSMQMSTVSSTSELMKFAMTRNLRIRNNRKQRYRASEQDQPFRAGSFVREFGSTDGEVSNNSSSHASIPQALTMLNGKEIMAVTDKRGYLPNALSKADSPSERLNILFLAIYSRYPTQSEMAKYKYFAKNIHTLSPLAKAMINSKSFLFIQ